MLLQIVLGFFSVLGVYSAARYGLRLFLKTKECAAPSLSVIEEARAVEQPLEVVLLPLQQQLIRDTMEILAHFPPRSMLKLDATMDNFDFKVKTPPPDENFWN